MEFFFFVYQDISQQSSSCLLNLAYQFLLVIFLLVSSCLRELPALCIWALTRQLLGVIIQVSGSIHCQGSCHGDYLISSFLGCWGRSTDFLRHHLLMQIGLITSPLIILSHKDASIYHWITGVISWLAASAQHIAVHTQQVTTKVRQQLHILRQASCQVVNSVHKNSYTRTAWIPRNVSIHYILFRDKTDFLIVAGSAFYQIWMRRLHLAKCAYC